MPHIQTTQYFSNSPTHYDINNKLIVELSHTINNNLRAELMAELLCFNKLDCIDEPNKVASECISFCWWHKDSSSSKMDI